MTEATCLATTITAASRPRPQHSNASRRPLAADACALIARAVVRLLRLHPQPIRREYSQLPPPVTRRAESLAGSLRTLRSTSSVALRRLRTHQARFYLSFSRCSCTVRVARRRATCTQDRRTILDGVSAHAASGRVLAIMGPSGAGKSTLLSILTLDPALGGDCEGLVKFNGTRISARTFKGHVALVEQGDNLWPFLSAREHLRTAVAMYQPEHSAADRREAVDALLVATGLHSAQHTRAGSSQVRGLSGGQRRRLSLAVALAKRPGVLILDEPTTGLDAASAAKMMHLLREVARQANIAVVVTIHQPSAAIFECLDDLLVLASGRTAYFGAAADLRGHLGAIGRPLASASANPAELLLDAVNADFTSPASVEKVLTDWARRGPPPLPRAAREVLPLAACQRAGFCRQFATLLRRHIRLAFREPMLYGARMLVALLVNTFFSVVYVHTRDPVQEQVLQRFFFLGFLSMTPIAFQSAAVSSAHAETQSFLREVRVGMFSLLAYVASTTLIQLTAMCALAVCALLPPFAITNLAWASFPVAAICLSALLVAYEFAAQACGHIFSPLLGIIAFLIYFLVNYLFSGFFVHWQDIRWPARIFVYFNPMRWLFPALVNTVFTGLSNQTDALECPKSCTVGSFQRLANLCGLDAGDQFQCDVGQIDPDHLRPFYCPGVEIQSCYGRTGSQCLESLSVMYDAAQPVDGPASLLAVAVLALCWKLLYVLVLAVRARAGSPPSLPATQGLPTTTCREIELKGESYEVTMRQEEQQPATSPEALQTTALSRQATMRRLRTRMQPFELSFVECSYDVPSAGASATDTTRLLHSVTASCRSGRVLTILGPSGAGKTTLLSMLTLEHGTGAPLGSVRLDGATLSPDVYRAQCVFVPQEDEHWAFLSCRDHIAYAVTLFRPQLSGAGRRAAIDQLLEACGLVSCQHTIAGGPLVRGLSGGQRRRLSVAIALAKQPACIFLDEPTSGLDAASAAKVMHHLRDTARNTNTAIVATIHQPSAAVYEGFDDVLVLSAGRTAYFGPANGLRQHLSAIGRPLPRGANPAEAVLDLVNPDFTDSAVVNSVLDTWVARSPGSQGPPLSEGRLKPAQTTRFCRQALVLFRKHLVLTVREPMLYAARALLNGLVMIFFCYVYLDTRDLVQSQVLPKSFLLFWSVNIPASFSMLAVFALNLETSSVVREVKNGMYSPLAYCLVVTLIQLPIMAFITLVGMLPVYIIIGPWGSFMPVLIVCTANLWAFECIAQFFSLVPNPLVGMFQFIATWTVSLLFCGFTIRAVDIVWPLRALYYALPLQWALSSASYAFVHACPDYAGTKECAVGPDCPRGFYCPGTAEDPLGLFCYGRTSEQILHSLQGPFSTLSTTDTLLRDISVILAIGSTCKLAHAILLIRRCSSGTMPKWVADTTVYEV